MVCLYSDQNEKIKWPENSLLVITVFVNRKTESLIPVFSA